MKRKITRIISLGLILMLCTGAAAESTDDLLYTTSEKLMKQLAAGSGFEGTLTLNLTAVEGRENDAFSTVKPLILDWAYINVRGDDETDDSGEVRLMLTLNSNDYQQGSAEISIQEGTTYLRSSLTGDSWYNLASNALGVALRGAEALGVLPDNSDLMQTRSLMPASLSFFANMAGYLVGGNFEGISDEIQQYTTKIDFWLEGYRYSAQMANREDGTSIMEIEYRLPPAAVKSQIKQFLVDLMNDEALLSDLASLMPKDQAALFLTPSLQPYYFFAVDELPLQDDLIIRRVVSFLGDTIELSVTMPLIDSANGSMTLQYNRMQGADDMPYDNTLSLTGENIKAELSYRTYETMTGATIYQGTVLIEGMEENEEKPKTLLVSFDVSSQSLTTKDLNGYETLNQSLKLSVLPGEIDGAEEAEQYVAFAKTDIALDMRFSSLSAKNAPTEVNAKLLLSGEEMPQDITLELSGTTTAKWTPEAFDPAQALSLANMSQEDIGALLSQAAVKGGLLFLPYFNLPQISIEDAN